MAETFTVRRDGRWRLHTPDGHPFLSIGVVHADDTNLRMEHNAKIFAQRYGGSRHRWIREGLVPELTSWGFNTIGWTSEYVSGTGLKDPWDEPYRDLTDAVTETNQRLVAEFR
ncbi:hypothetical protein [Saccharopolyspora sp. 5N708]|uniref:hypothetical protein n=1 Tax=Saccharopolyspora sp. 5N708 TaxID=3457424 RepID=UPI003FD2D478